MNFIAHTRLVTFQPYPHRAEQCALGVLVLLPGGQVQAHLTAHLRKAKAIDPACNIDDLREGMRNVAQEIEQNPGALALYETGVGPILISRKQGMLQYHDDASLQDAIRWTLAVSADPHKPTPSRERASVSRLFMEIKSAFSAHGWMAQPGQGISAHKIMPRFALAADEGLTVDFALQSDSLNCIQTVDYRNHPEQKRVEANAKLLTLGFANQFTATGKANRFAVIAGTENPEAKPGIRLAERVADEILVHESADDMNRLFGLIAQAMGQSPLQALGCD